MLTAPDETYARERTRRKRAAQQVARRELVEDYAGVEDDGGYNRGRRSTGLRLTFHGGLPGSVWGRVAIGGALLTILGLAWVAAGIARQMVLRDERFVLASSSSVMIEGNRHLSRADVLEVFGGDIERNILRVSLEERKAEVERIPWVKRAIVMRLLPDHIHVTLEERTPVAFVRQAGHIGLVDASGVLLGMGADHGADASYSFPVVTGITPQDPLSVRAARMKIFLDFTRDLDATGEKITSKLSEIDLSNPEDVKALIPSQGNDVLVHFGDSDYLDRYKKYEAHLPEWRAQYPKLSSVDMRYERQVVLEMQPGTAVPLAGTTAESSSQTAGSSKKGTVAAKPQSGKFLLGTHAGHEVVSARSTPLVLHGAKKAGHP